MAAGKGERMNLNYPKPLLEIDYPNGQKSIIANLLDVI
jgi:choline kinase